ncbi:SWIM zinc finger family protein [Flindersiella endophytica]
MSGPIESDVRGFPAFPKQGKGKQFARGWWGEAWVRALEDTSLAQEPLRRGRACARSGRVGPITISPGRIAAVVQDPDATPYSTTVYVSELTGEEWERFALQLAGRAGHMAALLEHEMPVSLAEAADDAEVPLLPGIGDLEPECDCPGWDHPCEHAAALCYQVAWLVDDDPSLLLLLRGRTREALLAELREAGGHHEGVRLSDEAVAFLRTSAAARARELLEAAGRSAG